jgi:MFS family permease
VSIRALESTRANLRAAGRTRILDLTIVVFLADVICGIAAPTFTVYARGLGASLILVGVLAAATGITRLVSSIPIGSLSDRAGRSRVIAAGVLAFAAAYALFTVTKNPELLVVPRVLFGLAIVSIFAIGIAYIADRTSGGARNLAIGAYVSAQGAGYAVGPFVAALLAPHMSVANIYRLTAGLAVLTAAYAWMRLRDAPVPVRASAADEHAHAPRADLRDPALVGVSIANLVMMFMFNGSVLPFLAVVATHLHLSNQKIALVYGIRAIASTLTRLPAGYAARRVSNRQLFLFAVALDAVAATLIGLTGPTWLLFGAVVIDGIAFGTFLGTSQSYVAESVSAAKVGAWLGVYSTAGAIGETVGAAAMGGIAFAFGTAAVFRINGLILAAGLAASWLMLRRVASSGPAEVSSQADAAKASRSSVFAQRLD